jgi:hypothetical protein
MRWPRAARRAHGGLWGAHAPVEFGASLRTMRFLVLLAAALWPFGIVSAQAPYAVGYRDVSWHNSSGFGSPVLFTRIAYPSTIGGDSAPIVARAGGWPAILWLHGFTLIGRDYMNLAERWVAAGFVVVLQDSAGFSWVDQVADAKMMRRAMTAANDDPADFFAGAFDFDRFGIAGHSMGGGSLAYVIADEPGFRCAFAFAPVYPGPAMAAHVTKPFGVVVGVGDTVTPWDSQSLPYYLTVAPTTGLKLWHLLDGSADHFNLAGLAQADDPSFLRAADVGLGFFRHFLDVDVDGLEPCLGPLPAAGATVGREHAVTDPRLWAAGSLRVGHAARVSVATEEGICGVIASSTAGFAVPTPIGVLQLDPANAYPWIAGLADRNRRFDGVMAVPHVASLVGTTIALQAIGTTITGEMRLGGATTLLVGP